MQFPLDVGGVLFTQHIRYWYLEEMMKEHGMEETAHPLIAGNSLSAVTQKVFRKHERPAGGNWRTDETYIKVKGVWKCLSSRPQQGPSGLPVGGKRDKAAARPQVKYLNNIVEQDLSVKPLSNRCPVLILHSAKNTWLALISRVGREIRPVSGQANRSS